MLYNDSVISVMESNLAGGSVVQSCQSYSLIVFIFLNKKTTKLKAAKLIYC